MAEGGSVKGVPVGRFDVGAYVPRVLLARAPDDPRHWSSDATLVFVDISGFTKLSDQLARRGRQGAEDLVSTLVRIFTLLLSASDDGGDVIKFGGDALLVSYTGPDHARRACHSVFMMQRMMRVVGNVELTGARARLRMSVGVHSGTYDFFLPGDEHQDLIVMGPAVSTLLEMESVAEAGEILVSPETAAALNPSWLGAAKGPGILLRRMGPMPSTGSHILFRSADEEEVWRRLPTVFRERPDLLAAGSDHRRAVMAFVYVDRLDQAVRTDPVGTLARMDRFAEEVFEAARDTGITVLDTDVGKDGYKYFLAAGAPTSLEDPEGRMMRALLQMVATDSGLSVRAGCAGGRVFAGTVGAPFRCCYTAMGDTTNLAARLGHKAGPGEVLVHAPMLDRTLAETTHGEPFHVELKGKPDPVPVAVVYDVHGVRPRSRMDVPFLGRDAELGRIQSALGSVRDGHGGVVEIIGEAGLGKTRLAELALQTLDLPVRTVTCDPYGALVPYHALRLLLRPLLGIPDDATPEQAGEILTAVVAEKAPQASALLPVLAPTVGADVPSTTFVDEIDPRFRATLLHQAVRDLLVGLLPGPSALLVDDAHWVDDSSAEALVEAFADLSHHGLGVVLTRRDDGDDGLHGGDDLPTMRIALEPMSEEEAVGLVLQLQGTPRPDQLEAILARGSGNPYFLMQLAMTPEGVELPDTVEELVGARIDALDADEREVLRRASVLGSRFREELYTAVTGDLPISQQAGPRLREFLTWTDSGEVGFEREIYREVAYGQLTFRARRAMHQQAAAAIEESPHLAGDDRLSMLSLHYDRAGLWQGSWTASRAAGDEARGAGAHDEAFVFYRRALAAGRRTDVAAGELAVVWEAAGDSAAVAGRFNEATEAYRTALRGQHEAEDRLRIELKHGRVLDQTGQFDKASRTYRQARRTVGDVPVAEQALCMGELDVAESASQYYRGNNVLARDLAEQAWDLVEGLPPELVATDRAARLKARAAFLYDTAAGVLDGPSGLRFHDLPLQMFRELGDHYNAGIACNNLGNQAYDQGRWEDAAALYAMGRDLCLRAGDRMSAAFNEVNLASIYARQGRYAEAEELVTRSRRTFESIRAEIGVATAQSHLAGVLLHRGDADGAAAELAAAHATFTALGSQEDVDECDVLGLEVLLLQGKYADLQASAEELLSRRPPITPLHRAAVRRSLGLGLLRSGDYGAAAPELRAALLLARQMESDWEIALTLEAQAELGGPDAEFLLEDAETLYARLGVLRTAGATA